ncbi:hypothetical protein KR222_005066, partial [Zaprionus bogoriensis]
TEESAPAAEAPVQEGDATAGEESAKIELADGEQNENIAGEPGEDVEPVNAENTEESESTDADAAVARKKKLERREEKRKAREMLDKFFRAEEQDTANESKDDTDQAEAESTAAADATEEREDEEEDEETKKQRKLEEVMQEAEKGVLELKRSIVQSISMTGDEDLKTGYSSSEEDKEYMRGTPAVSFKDEFMKYFYFPSMSDISTSSEDVISSVLRTSKAASQVDKTSPDYDKGRFVHSLTGEPLPETPSDEPQELAEEEEKSSSSSTTSDFEWPCALDNYEKVAPVAVQVDITAEIFLDMQETMKESSKDVTAANLQARTAREIAEIAIDFLYRTIDEAVTTAEYVDPDKVLAAKLDKMKLMAKLQTLVDDFASVKQFNKDVNVKMYEYYRRVGQLRCFDELPPKLEYSEYRRYKEALCKLDHLKEKAVETKKTNEELLASVRLDMDYVSSIALASVDSLERCIRETIVRKDAEFLPRIVEVELRRMQAIRNEISDNRLPLITRQHALGRVLERKRNFDRITDELSMDQFLMTQREVIALGTKVEERNHELIRMRDRCTKNMHQLACIREKTSMISANLSFNKEELSLSYKMQNSLRDDLLELKLQHARLKRQKRELNEKCGLLFKPALLHDFDDTCDLIVQKSARVKKLRGFVSDLEERIARFEKLDARSTFLSAPIN